ncbi:DUF551 domain-containing protein [Escherichia coli]|nr:DUF551 domain-containing protein [Escherichia coli]QSC79586.1 DUF551 domain-containing protein [Escherichia coli]QSC83870.1 DUF551 domain-containing protein [Escherichia coli]
MSAITKERIELFIKNPLDNGLTRGEQMELARIALASLEAEPVAYIFKHPAGKLFWALTDESNKEQADVIPVYAAAPVSVVPDNASEPLAYAYKELTPEIMRNHLAVFERYGIAPNDSSTTIQALRIALDGIERSAAMLQSGNFRENKNSSTNNFREIAETSTNYPVIPSEVLSAIREVAKIRADFDDFDGDRRGIGDCLDEAEQELIVTINKYASQLAAEPIAPNDVREQTAIPQVPVTPDGWISCSERMPDTKTAVLVAVEFDRKGDWRMKWATYIPGHPDANDGWIIPGASWKPSHWMPLPEPPL